MKPASPARCSGGLAPSECSRLLDSTLESEAAWVQRGSKVPLFARCSVGLPPRLLLFIYPHAPSGLASWCSFFSGMPSPELSSCTLRWWAETSRPRSCEGTGQLGGTLPLVSSLQKGIEGGPHCHPVRKSWSDGNAKTWSCFSRPEQELQPYPQSSCLIMTESQQEGWAPRGPSRLKAQVLRMRLTLPGSRF